MTEDSAVADLSIEELVETFRIQLGLQTWEDHRKMVEARWDSQEALSLEFRERYKRHGRQTGKTTYAILVAFAEALKKQKSTVLIIAPTKDWGRAICHQANNLITKLDLGRFLKAVVADHASNCVVYLDHSCDEGWHQRT